MTKRMNNDIFDKINKSIEIDEAVEQQQQIPGDTNVIVSKGPFKLKTKNEFVILFYESLDDIIANHKLTTLDLRVILKLLKKAQYGNLISYSQSAIAAELDTKQPNISRVIKKLKKAKIILETSYGEQFLNPQVLTKGSLNKQKQRENFKELKEMSLFDNY